MTPKQKETPKAAPAATEGTGVVKWFNDKKGYGFITRDDTNEDLFVHFSGIREAGGWRSLEEGVKVKFRIVQGDRGLKADDVHSA